MTDHQSLRAQNVFSALYTISRAWRFKFSYATRALEVVFRRADASGKFLTATGSHCIHVLWFSYPVILHLNRLLFTRPPMFFTGMLPIFLRPLNVSLICKRSFPSFVAINVWDREMWRSIEWYREQNINFSWYFAIFIELRKCIFIIIFLHFLTVKFT